MPIENYLETGTPTPNVCPQKKVCIFLFYGDELYVWTILSFSQIHVTIYAHNLFTLVGLYTFRFAQTIRKGLSCVWLIGKTKGQSNGFLMPCLVAGQNVSPTIAIFHQNPLFKFSFLLKNSEIHFPDNQMELCIT